MLNPGLRLMAEKGHTLNCAHKKTGREAAGQKIQ